MDEELKKMLQENLELSQEIKKIVKKIKFDLTLQKVFTALQVIFIVVPIVLGIIYLPPFLEKYYDTIITTYSDLLQAPKIPAK